MGRGFAAGAAFVAAAGSGVMAALLGTDSSLGLWVALGVLIVGGAILQGVVTAGERSERRVLASGDGAVAIKGSARSIRTRVRGGHGAPSTARAGDIGAYGAGAVSIGGDADGPVETDVTGGGEASSS